MDISKEFSLTDFLAYFFPGLLASAGLYLLLLLTPLQNSLSLISIDVTAGIFFLALSYVVGVVLSGFSLSITSWIEKIRGYKSPDDSIQAPEFRDETIRAFKDVFQINSESEIQWSKWHFRLCRALVLEKMPIIAQRANRQSSLRQLRVNLVASIFIWLFAGVGWGIWSIRNSSMEWGYILILISTLLALVSLGMTLTRQC